MDRCALFVDAGYLLSDGAMAVHGTRRREDVSWDHAGLLERLNSLARERTGLPVLRCYWYEATVEGRRTSEHDTLADLPGLKLRLSRIRPGRREGVDAQVHRDLMTLARNSAICDAVVVSGDEDLTQVVCDAQELGIRVTVMQVAADGSWSVSRALRQECDDLIEIGAADLRPYVTLTSAAESGTGGATSELTTAATPELTSGRSAEQADHAALQPVSAAAHGDQAPSAGGSYQPKTDQQTSGPYAPVPSGQSADASDPGSGRTGPSVTTGSPAPVPYAAGTGGYATPPADPAGVPSGAHAPGNVQGGAPIAPPGVYSAPQAPAAHAADHGGPGMQQPMGPQGGNRASTTPAVPALPSYPEHSPEPQQPALPSSPVPSGPLPAPTTPNGTHAQHHLPQQNVPHQNGTGGGYPVSHTPYGGPQPAPVSPQQPASASTIDDAVKAAHKEGHDFGESVARDAPALWLEAVLARKPRMPSDLEARLLQGSSLPIDFLLHDEVRHALRRGFWDALERARY